MPCNSDTGIWAGEVQTLLERTHGFTAVENHGGWDTDFAHLQTLCGVCGAAGARSDPDPDASASALSAILRTAAPSGTPGRSTLKLSRRQSAPTAPPTRAVCRSSGRSGLDLFEWAAGFRPKLPELAVLGTTGSADGTAVGCMWQCLDGTHNPVCRGFTFDADGDPSSSATACTLYHVRHGMPNGGGVVEDRELATADARYTHYAIAKCKDACAGSFADRTIMIPG